RIRHVILPSLRAENPALDERLAQTARSLREVAAVLDWAADQVDTSSLSARRLAAMPASVAKRVYARIAPHLEASHLDAIHALVGAPPSGVKSLDLPRITVIRDRDAVRVALTQPNPTVIYEKDARRETDES